MSDMFLRWSSNNRVTPLRQSRLPTQATKVKTKVKGRRGRIRTGKVTLNCLRVDFVIWHLNARLSMRFSIIVFRAATKSYLH